MLSFALHGPFQTLGNRTSAVNIPYGEERAVARESRLTAFFTCGPGICSGELVTTSHVVTTAGSYYPDDLGNLDRTEETVP